MKSSNIGQSRQFAEELGVEELGVEELGVEELEVVELGVVRDSSKPSNQSADIPSLVHSITMYSIFGELVPHTQFVYEVNGTPSFRAKSL